MKLKIHYSNINNNNDNNNNNNDNNNDNNSNHNNNHNNNKSFSSSSISNDYTKYSKIDIQQGTDSSNSQSNCNEVNLKPTNAEVEDALKYTNSTFTLYAAESAPWISPTSD